MTSHAPIAARAILTARLELRPGTAAWLRADLEGRAALERALGIPVPAGWPPEFYDADAVRWTLDHLRDHEHGDAFGFYYLVLKPGQVDDAPRGALAGSGGFKGPPDEHGEVELGYAIVPELRRHRLATEATEGLVAFAFSHPSVRVVSAQTLEGMVASIGVLERAGFRFAGEGDDPHAPPGERIRRYVIERHEFDRQREGKAR